MSNLEDIAKNYDAMLEEWKDLEQAVRHKEFMNLISFCNEDSKTVIEFGLGDGVATQMLCKHFEHVTGVDGAQTTLDLLKGKLEHNNITLEKSYVEDYKTDKKYDVIYMGHILEHLKDPVIALKNIKSLMHDKSIVYISVPNANSIHRLVATKMGLLQTPESLNKRDIELGHQIVFHPENFQLTVQEAGLKINHFGGVMIKPISNSQISKDWNREMIDGFIALGDDLPELCGDIYIVAKL
jgi:2-polyprenyl-3-methyl-5-hydroxy-6-metoxy-1,4-benzoquinol methylase